MRQRPVYETTCECGAAVTSETTEARCACGRLLVLDWRIRYEGKQERSC